MHSVLNRASRNFLWQHPWQLALAILGIALGVAVVIAINLALESSLNAFDRAGKAFSGTAAYRIIGGDTGIDEKLYRRLRVEQGIENLAPVVSGYVQLSNRADENFNLLGIDVLVEKSIQPLWQIQSDKHHTAGLLNRLLAEQNTVLIGAQTAQHFRLQSGDVLQVNTDSGTQQLKIVAQLTADNAVAEQVLSRLIISDIATAQEVLGMYGRLSSIEVAAQQNDAATLAKIRKVLPDNVILTETESQAQAMREMTRAFALDLKALGLLSLLVGMFLIYNTMTFLVVQRRRLIACLRAIGVTRQQIFGLLIGETLLLATIGTLLGIGLGIVLGQGLLQLVSRTLDAIYFRIDAASLLITPPELVKGAVLGLGTTLLAVLPPAWEATHFPPATVLIRSQLESGVRRLIKTTSIAGVLCSISGIASAWFSGKSVSSGLAGVFLLLFGFALLTPQLTQLLIQALERICGRWLGVLGRLPTRAVSAEISRTGIAIAALMVAVAATIGMDLMIGSFRHTVADWLQASLRADLYVSLPGDKRSVVEAEKEHRLKDRLSSLADVQMLSSVLQTTVAADRGFVKVSVYELNTVSKHGFIFKHPIDDTLWDSLERQQTVLVTEPYAYHHDIALGDKILLQTGQGKQSFDVIGIYADYSGDQGHLAMSRQIYRHYWSDLGFSGIGIYAKPGTNLKHLENQIAKLLSKQQAVKSDQAIYRVSMKMFEQTFTVTETLRWLSATIAFIGVFSALTALQFERTRQFGILRAIGVTPWQLAAVISSETGLIGLIAGLIAIPVGYIVAYMLLFVVYRRSFGWTLAFYPDAGVFIQGLALAVIAALLAGIFPALAMAKTQPAEALRNE